MALYTPEQGTPRSQGVSGVHGGNGVAPPRREEAERAAAIQLRRERHLNIFCRVSQSSKLQKHLALQHDNLSIIFTMAFWEPL